MTERPPCWPEHSPCPNRCALRYAEFAVYGRIDLEGDFRGWRVRGRYLVAPGGGRLPLRLLRALASRQQRVSRTRLLAAE